MSKKDITETVAANRQFTAWFLMPVRNVPVRPRMMGAGNVNNRSFKPHRLPYATYSASFPCPGNIGGNDILMETTALSNRRPARERNFGATDQSLGWD